MNSTREKAYFVQKLASQNGAQQSAVGSSTQRETHLIWRDGKIEKVSEATTSRLWLELYIDGRYSNFSTSDLRPQALTDFVENAAVLARALAKDPFRALPSPELYQGRTTMDLELEDSASQSITVTDLIKRLQTAESAAKKNPARKSIITVEASCGLNFAESFVIHSNGFEGEKRSSTFSLSSEVSVKDPDGRKPDGYDYGVTRFFNELPNAEEIGKEAARRALQQIGAKKLPSCKATLLVENRVGSALLGRFMAALSGSALQQKRSFLDGKVGKEITNPLLSLSDNPLIKRGLGSRFFDGEGIAAKTFPLIENGVLRNYYIDNYYGKKLSMAPTTGGLSNLEWKLGSKSKEQLIRDIGNGFLVTGFLGGNSNSTTGDFSLGVSGFVIKNGKVGSPFSGMNLSGNHLEFWKHLVALGNDSYRYSPMRCPSMVFEGAQLAGT